MEEQNNKRHVVWKNIKLIVGSSIFILVTFFGMLFIGVGLEAIGVEGAFWADGLARILVVCLMLYCFKKRYPNIRIGLDKGSGWGLGLLLGWPIYIATLINLYETVGEIDWSIAVTPTALDYIGYVVKIIGIGLFEEVLLRGIILNKMKNTWGNTAKGTWASVMISSLLFGLFHLINLMDQPWLVVATFTQVGYAFILGVFFAAIYVRTKNLWTVIAFHALYDLAGCIPDLFIKEVSEKVSPDISVMDGIMALSPFIILLVIGAFYMRKQKIELQEVNQEKPQVESQL